MTELRCKTKWIGCGWQRNWRLWTLKKKLKWIQEENEEMKEIGERWDRLGPYTESDCEMLQVTITVEEEEKEKDVAGPSMPVRGKRKRK